MKAKYALIALLAITFWGCDDNTAGIGIDLFPESDQNLNGKLSTFDVTTESIHAGQIYAKTNIGYVGRFTDETFGTYQAGFLAELNCPQGVTFPQPYKENAGGTQASGILVTDFSNVDLDENTKKRFSLIEGADGSIIGNCQVNIYLWYSSYFGDSLTASRLSIYEMNEKLNQKTAYYTDINADDYYDKSQGLLGTKSYTAVDLSVSDSVRKLNTYMPSVSIQLSQAKAKDLGDKLFQSSKVNGANFYKDFPNIFKGVYVKSDYGDGTVLYISHVQMDVLSIQHVTDSVSGLKLKTTTGKDSIAYTGRSFNSTREVIQANQLDNDKVAIQACIDNPEWTYMKSPAGIFTQATLPISVIAEELKGDTLNVVKLGIPLYNQSNDKKFGMSMPTSVLMVRKKYKDSFFENNQLSDNATSVLFNSSSTSTLTQYSYNNITMLIKNCLEDGEKEAAEKELREKGSITLQVTAADGSVANKVVNNIKEWEEFSDWNKVVLIPVLVSTDASSSSSSNIISIQHDLKPGYVRLKGGSKGAQKGANGKPLYPDNVLKVEVISTNFSASK